jgi:hypothetical protein
MRALKAVVATAGDLARIDRLQREEEVIVRAIREANLPKLVAEDVELFQGIIRVCLHFTSHAVDVASHVSPLPARELCFQENPGCQCEM